MMPELIISNILAVMAILNIWTFMAFGLDKMRAEKGDWRISEATLLTLSFIGGTAGAYLGRAVFRHKTRKQPFSTNLHSIAIGQAFLGAILIGFIMAG